MTWESPAVVLHEKVTKNPNIGIKTITDMILQVKVIFTIRNPLNVDKKLNRMGRVAMAQLSRAVL